MSFFEKKISGERKYSGFIVNVRKDVAEVQNGHRVIREVVEHPGGVAVVPVDADGNVLMVRQFRYPFGCELLEIPAGKLEPGEEPAACARRELSEETGCRAGSLVDLGPMYPSPGFCEEVLYLYLATDLVFGEAHPDEDEFLAVERMPMDELVRDIMENRVPDGKTVCGVLKAKLLLEK
ncbi:MAG: NUDIX hydrolase [Oscillospiraceae bacterium]|nr:NUDIX hydrolase [Oscillospiraceae bacterium]